MREPSKNNLTRQISTITEMKNSLDGLNGRFELAEELENL